MLVQVAIADAYGAGHEYTRATPDRPNDGKFFYQHPRHLGLKPGMYTDDSQMWMAVVRWVMQGDLTREALVDIFVRIFQQDPRDGYARGFQAFLGTVVDGQDFLARIQPLSDKSGAAMRGGSVGLLPDIAEILRVACVQASITHDTPGGRTSAQAAALMVHHQAYRLGTLAELPQFLSLHLPHVPWQAPWVGKTGQLGVDICRAAVRVLSDARTLTDVLTHSVAIGGDTDTLATIAMAAACLSPLPNDLSPTLIAGMEGGLYGMGLLRDIDDQMARHYQLATVSAAIVPR